MMETDSNQRFLNDIVFENFEYFLLILLLFYLVKDFNIIYVAHAKKEMTLFT